MVVSDAVEDLQSVTGRTDAHVLQRRSLHVERVQSNQPVSGQQEKGMKEDLKLMSMIC